LPPSVVLDAAWARLAREERESTPEFGVRQQVRGPRGEPIPAATEKVLSESTFFASGNCFGAAALIR
jgi:hypothetical protein